MPLYEYKCSDCNHSFEVKQHFNDDPVKVCPKCNGKVERVIGGGLGFIMKGAKSSSDIADSCPTCSGPSCDIN